MSRSSNLWSVDSGEYRRVYEKTVDDAKLVLSPDLLAKLSTPEAIALPEEYLQSSQRILVVGQETYKNFQPLTDNSYSAWSSQIGGSIAFDYCYSGTRSQKASKFWVAYEELVSAFAFASRRETAYANLCTVQLLQPISDSVSISKLSPEERMQVVRWQKDLYLAMLKFAKPKAILFMTGSLHWVIKHIFDGYVESTVGAEDANYVRCSAESFDIPMAQVNHPNARSISNLKAKREFAVAYLKEELQKRSVLQSVSIADAP